MGAEPDAAQEYHSLKGGDPQQAPKSLGEGGGGIPGTRHTGAGSALARARVTPPMLREKARLQSNVFKRYHLVSAVR